MMLCRCDICGADAPLSPDPNNERHVLSLLWGSRVWRTSDVCFGCTQKLAYKLDELLDALRRDMNAKGD